MEGGSQAQDHGQAIYAKIRYGVSSTFATGCSSSLILTIRIIMVYYTLIDWILYRESKMEGVKASTTVMVVNDSTIIITSKTP